MDQATDIDLTAIMEREDIAIVRRWKVAAYFTVGLGNGRIGTGATVGAALDAAKTDDLSWLRVAS